MKYKLASLTSLYDEERWDIDYHLPAEGIKRFDTSILRPISDAAYIVRDKRDPTKNPDEEFCYFDISSVDVSTGMVSEPQILVGSEAPSRARKVVQAYDIIISTCRPTRGAIAVVPEQYHNQICSTGFSVIRPKKGVNPFFLHFAIRLESTLEQFRKFSTGSSYPAILDSDVEKALIPLPAKELQDLIAGHILEGTSERERAVSIANRDFEKNSMKAIRSLADNSYGTLSTSFDEHIFRSDDIFSRINELPNP